MFLSYDPNTKHNKRSIMFFVPFSATFQTKNLVPCRRQEHFWASHDQYFILINMYMFIIVHLFSKSVLFRRNDLWRTSTIFSTKSKWEIREKVLKYWSIEKYRNILWRFFFKGGGENCSGGAKNFSRASRADKKFRATREICSYLMIFFCS